MFYWMQLTIGVEVHRGSLDKNACDGTAFSSLAHAPVVYSTSVLSDSCPVIPLFLYGHHNRSLFEGHQQLYGHVA